MSLEALHSRQRRQIEQLDAEIKRLEAEMNRVVYEHDKSLQDHLTKNVELQKHLDQVLETNRGQIKLNNDSWGREKQLREQLRVANDRLSGNMCGYCEKKMELNE